MLFIRLREYNDWEDEVWNWWLQFDGNEHEVNKLDAKLSDIYDYDEEENPEFTLYNEDIEEEEIVDKLVEYSEDDGYNPLHNKIVGTFICPAELGKYAENLYKGGIKEFFEAD